LPDFSDDDINDQVHNTNRHAKKQLKALKAEAAAEDNLTKNHFNGFTQTPFHLDFVHLI